MKTIKTVLDVVDYKAIGGSFGLYLLGKTNSYHDIDVIVDNIDKINLKFEEIPLTHKKRINRTKKYSINGIKFDFIENKLPFKVLYVNGFKVQEEKSILKNRDTLSDFYDKNYPHEKNKFKKMVEKI